MTDKDWCLELYGDVSALVGKTIIKIVGGEKHCEIIEFECSDGSKYEMFHRQDCCEDVMVEDVCGDLSDLIGSPVLRAEKVTNENTHPEGFTKPEDRYIDDSFTWTFYKIDTAKGGVTIRWLGSSNGYYSEEVSFSETQPASSAGGAR